MTLEGLGEVFKGDSADTCGGKFPLVSMGGRVNGQACADDERGPPSARSEILNLNWTFLFFIIFIFILWPLTVVGNTHTVNKKLK
jgi:hypothetical protein